MLPKTIAPSLFEKITIDCQSAKPDWSYLSPKILKNASAFSPTQISIILNACSRTNFRDTELLHSLAIASESKLREFQPFQVGLTVNALSKLNFMNTRLLNSLASQSLGQLRSKQPINPKTIAITFGGFCKVGFASRELVQVVLERLIKLQTDKISVADAAAIVYSFSNLGDIPQKANSLIKEYIGMVAESGSAEFSALTLTSISSLLENRKFRFSIEASKLESLIGNIQKDLSFSQLANVVAAVAIISKRLSGPWLKLNFFQTAWLQIKEKLKMTENPGNGSILLLMNGFSKSPGFWADPLKELSLLLDLTDLKINGFALVLNALSLHNMADESLLSNLVINMFNSLDKSYSEDEQRLTGQTVSLIVSSLVRLDLSNEASSFLAKTITPALIRTFSEQSLINATFAAMQIDALSYDVIKSMIDRMAQLKIYGSCPEAKSQLKLIGIMLWQRDVIEKFDDSVLHWLAKLLNDKQPPYDYKSSDLHLEVADVIAKLTGAQFRNEYVIGPYSADIVIEASSCVGSGL